MKGAPRVCTGSRSTGLHALVMHPAGAHTPARTKFAFETLACFFIHEDFPLQL